MEKVTGSALVHAGEVVQVGYDEDSLSRLARTMAINLLLNKDALHTLITEEELEESFCYSLKVVLTQDLGIRPVHEVVPRFMSDLTMSLSLKERNIVVHPEGLTLPERPHSYGRFLDVMGSMGFPVDYVLRVLPEDRSRVLTIGKLELNGTVMLVGIESDASIEEMVVRALLEVPLEQQAKLERIIGAYDHVYISRDELLRQWGVSILATK